MSVQEKFVDVKGSLRQYFLKYLLDTIKVLWVLKTSLLTKGAKGEGGLREVYPLTTMFMKFW